MIKTFILHFIYEECIQVFFRNISSNFSAPALSINSMEGRMIKAIETYIESGDSILKILYTDVLITSTDDEGMIISAACGIMQEYPIREDGKIYTNYKFTDYIRYEDIIEIFE